MSYIIEKNTKFFEEVSRFNPKLSRILETEHGWTDKLVHRSDDASLSQSPRRREGTEASRNADPIKGLVPKKVGRD